MVSPSISYIIPAYNAAGTLRDTLTSLAAQTRPDWEAVVVDDGSTDDPGEVVTAIGDRRVRVIRQENAGLAGARNTGWNVTGAPAVCFLDADDTVAPRHAERLLTRLSGHDAAACASRMVGPGLEDLSWLYAPGDHDFTPERLLRCNPVCVGAVVIDRAAPARLGLIEPPFDESMRVAEDWDLWLRMTLAGARWALVESEPLFSYRLRAGSLYGDIRAMWRAGLGLIGRAARGPEGHRAAREWGVRCLARAIAADEGVVLVHEVRTHLGPLRDEDEGVLLGALRWAFCREYVRSPDYVGDLAALWKRRIVERLGDEPVAVRAAERIGWGDERWSRLADDAAARAARGERIVVYGVGRNGRRLLEMLRQRGVQAGYMDDHPGARGDGPRVRISDLTNVHTVLVTPDERGDIVQRLRGSPALVLHPESVSVQDSVLSP